MCLGEGGRSLVEPYRDKRRSSGEFVFSLVWRIHVVEVGGGEVLRAGS